jgi:hypothetical protein
MARNDETVTPDDSADAPTARREPDPKTAEYPEITSGPADPAPTSGGGWSPKIGDRVDPRDRPDRDAPVIVPVRAGGGAMRGLFWLAEGNFEVIVDVQKDRKYIPDFLLNERILFVAAGSVEVYVDFAGIGQGAVKESDDRRTVEITLPAPQLRPVRINNDRSYVYQEDRGLFNRLADAFKSDPNRLQEVYKLAEEKIGAAAKEAGLSKRAEENTRKMLQQFLGALGYTSVTVNFPAS